MVIHIKLNFCIGLYQFLTLICYTTVFTYLLGQLNNADGQVAIFLHTNLKRVLKLRVVYQVLCLHTYNSYQLHSCLAKQNYCLQKSISYVHRKLYVMHASFHIPYTIFCIIYRVCHTTNLNKLIAAIHTTHFLCLFSVWKVDYSFHMLY